MVEFLLLKGAKVNKINEVGILTSPTLPVLPTMSLLTFIVQSLNLLHMIQEGQSPLWLASNDGQSVIASLLLQHHAEVDLHEEDLPDDVRHSNV